jgi:hypothetical protein
MRTTQNLPIYRHNTLTLLREGRHEPLKRGTKPVRIEQPEQAAEGVMAGNAVGQRRKPRSKGSFALANSAISVAFSPPERTVQRAIIRTSCRSCKAALRFAGLPGLPSTHRILPWQPPRAHFTPPGRIDRGRAGQEGIGGQVNSKCESPASKAVISRRRKGMGISWRHLHGRYQSASTVCGGMLLFTKIQEKRRGHAERNTR